MELSPDETRQLIVGLHHERAEGFSADFTEERHRPSLRRSLESKGIVHLLPENRFRREITEPSPSLTVSDGETLWIHYPAFNETEIYELSGSGRLDSALRALLSGLSLSGLEDDYRIEAWSIPDGHRLLLHPKSRELRRSIDHIEINLDGDRRVRQVRLFHTDGGRTVTTFDNYRASELEPDDFAFEPPEGGTVSRPLGGS